MGEIQKLTEAHIPEVAALELKVFHARQQPAGPALQKYFAEIFLRNPWRDEEISSLVYLDKGKVAGFQGVVPRRMVFRGAPVRVAVASQLMVDTEPRRGFAGLELVRHLFSGPQDLTLTDGATEAAYTVFTAAGARAAQLYGMQWTRTLRPFGHARGFLAAHPRLPSPVRAGMGAVAPVCALADAALSRVRLRGMAPPETRFHSVPVDADGLLECASSIGWREPLRPCYDPDTFRWQMAQASLARAHGSLQMAVVYDESGARAGWYAYFSKPGGVSNVLQIGSRALHFDEVLAALLQDAWSRGAAAVNGQVIPRFLLNFALQRCALRYPGNGVLVHSRNPEIMNCILRGDASLTRLDGEWWLRFAVEDWD